MTAYLAGNVTLANAVGTGISDDKAIYTYMPELTKFFLEEEPMLKNVPTWRCREPEALSYVLDHLEELVVKEVAGSGGYGMLVGPRSTKDEIDIFRAKLKANPDDFIAQPTLALHLPDVRRRRCRTTPCGPSAIRPFRHQRCAHRARRSDPRCLEGGIAGRELLARRGNKDTWILAR